MFSQCNEEKKTAETALRHRRYRSLSSINTNVPHFFSAPSPLSPYTPVLSSRDFLPSRQDFPRHPFFSEVNTNGLRAVEIDAVPTQEAKGEREIKRDHG